MNLKIGAALYIITLLAFYWYSETQFEAGYNKCKAEHLAADNAASEADAASVKEVIKWRIKTKVEYRDKIKLIREAEDPTGCADTKLTDMGFSLQPQSH